jgi:UDP-N-acetylmuramoylalanine--D-glutamate ligase
VIPITTFAGKKIAVFGLGSSGLVCASALLAGGADVIAFDDDATSVAKASAAGIPTADLGKVDWSRIAALVLAPGVPLTHPSPHWVVQLARGANVAAIGDVELFCRERRAHAPGAPFVAITGTNGKSTTTALIAHLTASSGMDTQLGGNIGTAILSLAPPQAGRVHVIECSSYQIDLAPSIDPSVGILINLSEDHLDRHGTMANYAAVKERLVTGVREDGTAIVGVDDKWCDKIAARLAQAGKRVVQISVRHKLNHGLYYENGRIMRARGGESSVIAELGGIGSLRGCTMRKMPPAQRQPRSHSALIRQRSRPGCDRFQGCRTEWKKSAGAAPFCSSTIPRPPMPTRPPRRWPAFPIFSGSPADDRRPAASRACGLSFHASERPI